jgi:pSer/pThr/pTyr-binding forkhead associated (FHA) protein
LSNNIFQQNMIIITCSNKDCGMGLQVDETKLTPTTALKCPYCGTITRQNNIQQPAAASPPPRPEPMGNFPPPPPPMNPQRQSPPPPMQQQQQPPPMQRQTPQWSSQPVQSSNGEVGWLIVHDEKTPPKTLNLSMGKNIIGRGKDAHHILDVGDKYMSRRHCVVEVVMGSSGGYQYIVYDYGHDSPSDASTNGTFLNANVKRLENRDEMYLKNNDVIQIGRTKVVLQTLSEAGSSHKAMETVIRTPYARTVIQ